MPLAPQERRARSRVVVGTWSRCRLSTFPVGVPSRKSFHHHGWRTRRKDRNMGLEGPTCTGAPGTSRLQATLSPAAARDGLSPPGSGPRFATDTGCVLHRPAANLSRSSPVGRLARSPPGSSDAGRSRHRGGPRRRQTVVGQRAEIGPVWGPDPRSRVRYTGLRPLGEPDFRAYRRCACHAFKPPRTKEATSRTPGLDLRAHAPRQLPRRAPITTSINP